MRGGSGVSGSGMGGGLGSDKMRNLENLINPNVRNKMSEQDDRKAEQTKEQQQRRLRAKIPRSFARPVEQVLGVYNDASTNLYNVLGVGRTADEVALKKAYRNLALVLHPGVYVSGEWEGREGWGGSFTWAGWPHPKCLAKTLIQALFFEFLFSPHAPTRVTEIPSLVESQLEKTPLYRETDHHFFIP